MNEATQCIVRNLQQPKFINWHIKRGAWINTEQGWIQNYIQQSSDHHRSGFLITFAGLEKTAPVNLGGDESAWIDPVMIQHEPGSS